MGRFNFVFIVHCALALTLTLTSVIAQRNFPPPPPSNGHFNPNIPQNDGGFNEHNSLNDDPLPEMMLSMRGLNGGPPPPHMRQPELHPQQQFELDQQRQQNEQRMMEQHQQRQSEIDQHQQRQAEMDQHQQRQAEMERNRERDQQPMARRDIAQQPRPPFNQPMVQQLAPNQGMMNQNPPQVPQNQNQVPPGIQIQGLNQQQNQPQMPANARLMANQQRQPNGQNPVPIIVQVHHPMPSIIINTGSSGDGKTVTQISQVQPTENQNGTQFESATNNGTSPMSGPRNQGGDGRERRHPLDQSQRFINPNEQQPKSRNKNKPKRTHSLKSMEFSDEDVQKTAEEDENASKAPKSNDHQGSDNGDQQKRNCLSGNCLSNRPAFPTKICRGKECALEMAVTQAKERRDIRPAAGDSNSLESSTVTPQFVRGSSASVIVTKETLDGSSATSNEMVCALKNVPQVPDCVKNFPWQEKVNQPLNCPTTNRKWQCFCGFFDD